MRLWQNKRNKTFVIKQIDCFNTVFTKTMPLPREVTIFSWLNLFWLWHTQAY